VTGPNVGANNVRRYFPRNILVIELQLFVIHRSDVEKLQKQVFCREASQVRCRRTLAGEPGAGRGRVASVLPHPTTPSGVETDVVKAMARPRRDPVREDRIHNEVFVDDYGPEEQAGW
jgi:hypothetical protein